MNILNHFDFDRLNKYHKEHLPTLYKEQIPFSIFMFVIGISTTMVMFLFQNSEAGKSSEQFLSSLFSGLGQLKVFLLISITFLLISSLVKLTNIENQQEPNYISKIAVQGLFSFLVPFSVLTFSVMMVGLACIYSNPELASTQKVTINSLLGLFYAGIALMIFPTLFYIVSCIIDTTKSKFSSAFVSLLFVGLFLIAIFDVAK